MCVNPLGSHFVAIPLLSAIYTGKSGKKKIAMDFAVCCVWCLCDIIKYTWFFVTHNIIFSCFFSKYLPVNYHRIWRGFITITTTFLVTTATATTTKKNINNKKRTVYCQFRPYRYIINCGVKNEKQNMKFLFVFFFQLPKYPPPYSVLVYNANGWTRKAGEVKWGGVFYPLGSLSFPYSLVLA